jgi:hypothetical protein
VLMAAERIARQGSGTKRNAVFFAYEVRVHSHL